MLGFPVDRARGGPSSGFSRLTVDDFHARTYFLCETGLEYMPSPPSPGHSAPPAPLLGDLLSCHHPAPDASLTSLSSTLAGPSRLPKALLLPHHTPAYFPAALSWGAHGPMREGCTHLCVDPEAPCQAAGSSGPGTWPPHPPLLVGISGTLSERPCERGRNLEFVLESYKRTTF